MNGITHKQARRYMLADLDGLLAEDNRRALQAHLDSCPACRADSESFATLTTRLQTSFHAKWDVKDGPSKNVLNNIRSQTRRIIMSNRINLGMKALAGIAALVVLGFAISFVIPRLQNNSVATNETQTVSPVAEVTGDLIAFVSIDEKGNREIYTMKSDGGDLTNITNNEALDSNPAWSPDGKRIAFHSNRTAFTQIYLMEADGSNVTQLTFDKIDHEMTMNYAQSSPWSPDGSHLLFFHRMYPEKGSPSAPLELYSIDINTGTQIMLARGNILLFNVTWSPDGKHIAFILENPGKPGEFQMSIVDENGNNLNEITKLLHPNEQFANFNYRWSPDGQSLIFIAMNEKSQQWFAYEAHLDGSPLVQKARTNSTLGDWWDGTTFIVGSRTTLTWLSPDGTKSTLELFEKCNSQDDPQYGWFYKRSSKGDYLVGVFCLHSSDLFFYFVNSDGAGARQLFNSPLHGDIIDTAWSDDGNQLIATLSTSMGVDLYRFDIEEMLKDPSTKPIQLTTDGAVKSDAVWQPTQQIAEVVKETPAPEVLAFDLTVAEAETLAGFHILEPTHLPTGFIMEGASYDAVSQKVTLRYISQNDSGVLYIFQERGTLTQDPAIQAYTTPVVIGDLKGEYSRGAWAYESQNTTTPTWDPNADHYSLRWQQGEWIISIDFLGGETITPLLLDELIRIAESMQ